MLYSKGDKTIHLKKFQVPNPKIQIPSRKQERVVVCLHNRFFCSEGKWPDDTGFCRQGKWSTWFQVCKITSGS